MRTPKTLYPLGKGKKGNSSLGKRRGDVENRSKRLPSLGKNPEKKGKGKRGGAEASGERKKEGKKPEFNTATLLSGSPFSPEDYRKIQNHPFYPK